MRRTAPGLVQLPGSPAHHTTHGHGPLKARSPAGSPLARSSTTSATYFDEETGSSSATTPAGSSSNAGIGLAKGASNSASYPQPPAASVASRPPNSRTKSNSSIHSISSLKSGGSGSTSGPSNSSERTAASASAYGHPHIRPGVGASSGSTSYYPGISPAGSGTSSSTKATPTQADEIESSLRQWRNHVFPSLQAGNYISPGQETPERDPIHPLVEPILPSIFATGASNERPEVITYSSPREFLEDVCEDDEGGSGEENEKSWRLEMLLGQTEDMLYSPQAGEGLWMGVWSGKREQGTRLLEFCLMKIPSRPLVLISPIPICVLPTAFLQDRMHVLLNSYLALPSIANSTSAPFSLIMGPTRVVEAFLLHFDGIDIDQCVNPGLDRYRAQSMSPGSREREALSYYQQGQHSRSPSLGGGVPNFDPSSTTWSSPTQENGRQRSGSLISNGSCTQPVQQHSPVQQMQQHHHHRGASPQIHHASTSMGRTVKPLLHTRIAQVPPMVSLSEGFVVRLVNEKDDLACLAGLFRTYSATLDHYLDDYSARKALAKAMANKSVWIYHLASHTCPGLSLIAGFLTTERRRRFKERQPSSVIPSALEEPQDSNDIQEGRGSIAITAIFVEEAFRGRGVAESLVRTATRYYLTGEEVVIPPSPILKKALADKKKKAAAAAASGTPIEEEKGDEESRPITPNKPKEIYNYLSVYVDPRNESTCRVFPRVGYGIMEKEEREEIPIRLLREALEEQYKAEWEARNAAASRRSSLAIDILPTQPGGGGAEELDTPIAIKSTTSPAEEKEETGQGAEPSLQTIKAHDRQASAESSDSEQTNDNTPQATTTTITDIPNPLENAAIEPVESRTISSPGRHVHYAHSEGENEHEMHDEEEEEEEEMPMPYARSVEEWQVVSLKRALEEGRRARGIKKDDAKRLSIDGPWN